MSESKELLVNSIKDWIAINNKMNELQKVMKDLRLKKTINRYFNKNYGK